MLDGPYETRLQNAAHHVVGKGIPYKGLEVGVVIPADVYIELREALVAETTTPAQQERRAKMMRGGVVDFPPDCADGERCKACRKCYSLYVQEKWEGKLD